MPVIYFVWMIHSEANPIAHAAVSDMTVIGCTLSIVNQSAFVDSQTKRLVSAEPVVTKTSSEWAPWTMSNYLPSSRDMQLDSVSNAEY